MQNGPVVKWHNGRFASGRREFDSPRVHNKELSEFFEPDGKENCHQRGGRAKSMNESFLLGICIMLI